MPERTDQSQCGRFFRSTAPGDSGPVRSFRQKAAETALRFHKSLPEYRETPLISLSHLSGELGVGGIYVKDESWRFGLNAFKGLGGAYAMFAHSVPASGAGSWRKRTLELFRRRRSESAYRRSPLQRPPTEITGRAFPGQRSCSGAAPGCLCRRVLLRRQGTGDSESRPGGSGDYRRKL